jgi:DNA-directed RNA polymerase specialized sigma24 family protein
MAPTPVDAAPDPGALFDRSLERPGPDVRSDFPLDRGARPEATPMSPPAHLPGRGEGDDDQSAARAEPSISLQEALDALDPLDREVHTPRHGEQLPHDEATTVPGIPESQASESSSRALKRMTRIPAAMPGFRARS